MDLHTRNNHLRATWVRLPLALTLALTAVGTLAPEQETFAQATAVYRDPQAAFKEAHEFYQHQQYSLAYPIFRKLERDFNTAQKSTHTILHQEVKYYSLACGLKQNEAEAAERTKEFILLEQNTARAEMLSFHLAEYYFRQQNITEALRYYEQANIAHLSNEEIAAMKFHQGYGYFTQQKFSQAKPLLNAIRQMKDDANFKDANYYYGFIAFYERNYTDALTSFRVVENEPQYEKVVPYYIAEIYYFQGEKEKAIEYAEAKLKKGNQYYDIQMRQMVGHAYFEKKEYAKALPYLEEYVKKAPKVTREDLYELSYCYYQAGNYTKSIEGFKQLSGKEDSLSQSSMYMLGDAYLRTGQKANARNAFLFCSSNSSNQQQKEVSLFNYAKLSYELGYQDVAITEMKRFLQEYPQSTYNTEAREILVSVLANTNNYKDALAYLESLQNPGPAAKRLYPRILYGRATEFINDGLLASADDLLDKALADPNNIPVLPFLHFWKGEIAFRTGNPDAAIRHYTSYLSSGAPTNDEVNGTNARYNLGHAYLRKENYKQALSQFESVNRTASPTANPVQQDAYLRSADCYYMSREYAKARSMYSNVVSNGWPAADYASFQNAMIAGVNQPKEKISLLNSMVRQYPQSTLTADANMEIAKAYLANEQFAEGIPYLNNVLKSGVTGNLKPEAYLKLGIAYYNLDKNQDALAAYQSLMDQYPNSPEAEAATENVRNIYVEQGRTDDYVAFMKKAGKAVSVSEEDSLMYASAEIQYMNENYSGAQIAFTNYLSRFPDGGSALDANYYLAEIYNNKKDWANASKYYEAVALKAPNKFAERSVLQAARLNFFDLKNYEKAAQYFTQLKSIAASQENRLEAMRGLLRSQYQLNMWAEGAANAKELLAEKGASTDDKVIANMALAKSYQVNNQRELAISTYKTVAALNKAAYGAEARYEIAKMQFELKEYKTAEKSAFEVINKSGSYDLWLTRAYILLGDIYFAQKDYFNAKATYQSIVDNSNFPDLKEEAQQKLDTVTKEEAASGKLGGE